MGNLTSSGKPRASNGFLLVPVGRADKEIGRQQGGHSVEPSGNGGATTTRGSPREEAAATLVLLGGEAGHADGGPAEKIVLNERSYNYVNGRQNRPS